MKPRGLWVLWLVGLLVSGCGCRSVVSEKQVARPMAVPYSVADPSFANSMGNLLGAPLVGGNSVVQLVNGDQIFPAMLKEIRAAQKSITLETFIWAPGEVSTQFVTALCDRARAGVKVHVIVDAMGSGKMEERDIKQMTDAGIVYLEYDSR